jgi:hypothetical protein
MVEPVPVPGPVEVVDVGVHPALGDAAAGGGVAVPAVHGDVVDLGSGVAVLFGEEDLLAQDVPAQGS